MKKALSFILAVVMTLGCLGFSVYAADVRFENVSKWDNSSITEIGGEGSYLGYHTRVNVPFTSASFRYITYNDRAGSFDFSMYKWQGTFEDTLKEENLIVKQSITGDGSTDLNYSAPVSFDAQPAGEYLFYLEITSGTPDIYSTAAEVLTARNEAVDGYVYNNSTTPSQDYMPWIRVWGPESYNGDAFSGTSIPSTDPDDTTETPETEEPEDVTPPVSNVAYPETAYEVDPEDPTVIGAVENARVFKGGVTEGGIEIINYGSYDLYKDFRIGDVITFKIKIFQRGIYDLAVNFIWQNATEMELSVDEGDPIKMKFNSFINWQTPTYSNPIQLELGEGEHTLKFTHSMADSGIHIQDIKMGPEGSIPNYEGRIFSAVYDANKPNAHRVQESYGYRTVINADFNQISLWMPNWGKQSSACVVALYAWEGNMKETLEGDYIMEEMLDPMGPDAWHTFDFDDQAAGEYLVYVYDAIDSAGVYYNTAEDLGKLGREVKGYSYINGEPTRDMVPQFKITTVEPFDGEDLFGDSEPDTIPPADETTKAPETTVAPETTAPETTAPETTVPETTAPETTAPDTTVAPETTDAPVADTTSAPAEETTVAPTATTAAVGTKAPAATTAAETSGGCGSVVASASAIALIAVASAAAVVLKKKED